MIPDTTFIQQLEKALPSYIARRRWFRAKALSISEVHVNHVIEADGFLLLVMQVHFAEGGADLYFLPITSVTSPNVEELLEEPIATFQTLDGDPVSVYDAVFSPFFRTVLFRTLSSGGTFASAGASFTAISSLKSLPVEGVMESFVSRAEQSNTSIIYGKDFILKLFRKLESGINPDIEMGAFLTAQGFPNTPAVLATLEFKTSETEVFSAGILQQFVPNQGDAWKYTLQELTEYYDRAAKQQFATIDLLGDYAESATLLGIRTAQMHAALATGSIQRDFVPAHFTESDARHLSDEIAAQAQSSLNLLREKILALSDSDKQLATAVLSLEARLQQRFRALSSITTSAKRIRYHGDYHLGQILYTGSDFMIIDFEGEPARPLSERRQKALALRDVAGMLRSFHYAAFGGINGLIPKLQTSAIAPNRLAEDALFWYKEVSKLYLDAYFAESKSQPFLPSTTEQRNFFLDAFLLQKALYEVQYELNNRPTWVGIPLRGILSLIGA